MEYDAEVSLLKLEIEMLEKELTDAERQRSRDMLTQEYANDLAVLDYLREELDASKARLRRLLMDQYDDRELCELNKSGGNTGNT